MKNPSTSLDQLHDIVPADPVSVWPLASGWWLLITLATLALIYLATLGFLRHRANAYRRDALHELESLDSRIDFVSLLKRTALAAWPRDEVASLGGDEWLNWLEQVMPIPDDVRGELRDGPYSNPTEPATPALREFTRNWIQRHQR